MPYPPGAVGSGYPNTLRKPGIAWRAPRQALSRPYCMLARATRVQMRRHFLLVQREVSGSLLMDGVGEFVLFVSFSSVVISSLAFRFASMTDVSFNRGIKGITISASKGNSRSKCFVLLPRSTTSISSNERGSPSSHPQSHSQPERVQNHGSVVEMRGQRRPKRLTHTISALHVSLSSPTRNLFQEPYISPPKNLRLR
ncbi:hypothetical protein B0T20DRAFT_112878 [Sordaria brevicollis]|uniref:Uncharacterized protein n=1 Tax=Sordaria brevicollis TaxID=83679 RepID=A0AAE0UFA7_SORBR|nr:hypothetical protein B0T20DRAFT_112878 [Sordaria brevicollis]